MKKYVKHYALLVAIALLINQVNAAPASVNARQASQKARIAQGVATGELTRKETTRLVRGQAQLQRMENRAKADGVVTRTEQVRLQRKANKESRKIRRNKNDGQSRPQN
ncbi:MAG: hypothetical protein V2I33_11975 [Kangiellaceae bacterium]|jgi:phage terminase Nu1 subunit (DNA packaging protein)|nr:hypothetical protein [Kangiellaceae bacterium]